MHAKIAAKRHYVYSAGNRAVGERWLRNRCHRHGVTMAAVTSSDGVSLATHQSWWAARVAPT